MVSPKPPSDLVEDVTLMDSLNFLLLIARRAARRGGKNGPDATSR
jgi:hypothetical protein